MRSASYFSFHFIAELGKLRFLDEAEWVVSDVERVLGRPRGIRIGEAPDRDGQYFHYLAMWLYALSVLARYVPAYRRKGVDLVHQIHRTFVVPGRGVVWKMKEDLSPNFGRALRCPPRGCPEQWSRHTSRQRCGRRLLPSHTA
jgi:hypothetical protein